MACCSNCSSSSSKCTQVCESAVPQSTFKTFRDAVCKKFIDLGPHPDEVIRTAATVATAIDIPAVTSEAVIAYNPATGQLFVWTPNIGPWVEITQGATVQDGTTEVREQPVADRISVRFEGSPGDVTATYAQGQAVITVNNDAVLQSVRVFGANADLSASQDFKIDIIDPNLGGTASTVFAPIGLAIARNDQTAPTEAVYWAQNTDPDPEFRMFDIVGGGGITGQFTNLNNLVSHILALTF